MRLQFKEDLIRSGLEGGKRAANALRNAVFEQCPDLTDDTEIIARVCANVSGLAKAMKRDGCLDDTDDLREFALGFTQGKASFDFIDVGHGKERADSKIKGANKVVQLSTFLACGDQTNNPQNPQDGISEIIIASIYYSVSVTMPATLHSWTRC